MTAPIVLYGHGLFAELAAYYLRHDAQRTVTAFTAYPPFRIQFDRLVRRFPPAVYEIFLPLAYARINGLRQTRCVEATAAGYTLASYVSPRASVWPDLRVGGNVMICEQATIQPFVRLGDDVTVRSGARIGHHSRVGSHTFIATGAVTGGGVTIGERCFIGLGAVLRDRITLGERCFIGAGAVVVADTEADGVYIGNPARRVPNKTSLDVTIFQPPVAN